MGGERMRYWIVSMIVAFMCRSAFADKPNIIVIMADDMGYQPRIKGNFK
jgi:hypothetical protein